MVENEKNTGRRPLVTEFQTVPLWDYTVAVYRRSAVAKACLELQHSAHIDVPLFFCAGYASLGWAMPLEMRWSVFQKMVKTTAYIPVRIGLIFRV